MTRRHVTDEDTGAQKSKAIAADDTANEKFVLRPETCIQRHTVGTTSQAQSLQGLDTGIISSEHPGGRSRWKISWESAVVIFMIALLC